MEALLKVNQLVKNYHGFSLGPLDLCLEAGTAAGLVGANGAGKSSLFRCLMGLVRPDQGDLGAAGIPQRKEQLVWRRQVGYVGDFTAFLNGLSGGRNLQELSRFYPTWSDPLATLLAGQLRLDLDVRVSRYSTGQRTKLALVAALAHRPRLLLLDEPGNGLDPVSRQELQDCLFAFLEPGDTALLYATHHVGDIERLADRLLFLHDGCLIGNEVKEDLLEKWRSLAFRSDQPVTGVTGIVELRNEPPWQQLVSSDYRASLEQLRNLGIGDVDVAPLSLEQITVQILKNCLGGHHGAEHSH